MKERTPPRLFARAYFALDKGSEKQHTWAGKVGKEMTQVM